MARRRESQPDVFTNIILLIGRALWLLLSLPFRAMLGKRPTRLNQSYYQTHWKSVENQLHTGGDQSIRQAVMDGDKLLDHAMRELNLSGASFADRLRSAETRFSQETYQSIWTGHKLRNQIAHEVGHTITRNQAEQALQAFRRGLQALGAL